MSLWERGYSIISTKPQARALCCECAAHIADSVKLRRDFLRKHVLHVSGNNDMTLCTFSHEQACTVLLTVHLKRTLPRSCHVQVKFAEPLSGISTTRRMQSHHIANGV